MPDDPHAPENRSEASFMLAAEKAIGELRDEGKAMRKALRWKNVQMILLAILTAVVIILSVVTLRGTTQANDNNRQLRQQVITTCKDSNRFREQQTQAWDFFIDALVAQPVGQDVQAEVKAFKQWTLAITDENPALRAGAVNAGALMDRIVGNVKDPRLPEFVLYLKGYIARINAPRNCAQAYSVKG